MLGNNSIGIIREMSGHKKCCNWLSFVLLRTDKSDISLLTLQPINEMEVYIPLSQFV